MKRPNRLPDKASDGIIDFENLRMKLWIDVWAHTASANNCINVETCTKYADKALKDFDDRFKAPKPQIPY